MEKTPTNLLEHVLMRVVAWGFSSSGVERSFSIGSWAKHAKRDVTPDLAWDEVSAIQFPEQHMDECLVSTIYHAISQLNLIIITPSPHNIFFSKSTCNTIRLIMMAQQEWVT